MANLNPMGSDFPEIERAVLINGMIQLKAENYCENSIVLMFDGKKIRRGTDFDLLGFEDWQTLESRKKEHDHACHLISEAIMVFRKAGVLFERLELTTGQHNSIVSGKLTECLTLFSRCIRNVRERKRLKELQLLKLKEKSSKDTIGSTNYAYAIDMCRTVK